MMRNLATVFIYVLCTVILPAQNLCYVDQPQVDTYLYTQGDFGQSFMPCSTGELYRMDVPIHNLQAGDFTAALSLYEGDGYLGDVIYTAEVTISDEWGGFLIHTLNDEVMVLSGQTYTYRLDFDGNYGTMWANFSNTYSDGQNYWNGQAQATIDMGFLMHIVTQDEPCVTWRGEHSDNWNEPLNWSTQEVPDSTDCVLISEGSPYSPVLDTKGEARQLTIDTSGIFHLSSSGELTLHEGLEALGSSDFLGNVVMRAPDNEGEILGSPIFKSLRIEGVFSLTEPITILDVLDLEEGFLVNTDSELLMPMIDGNHAHVYMPNANLSGQLSFIRTRQGFDPEPLGIPFTDLNLEQLVYENEGAEIKTFRPSENLELSQSTWTDDLSNDDVFSRSSSVLFNGSEDQIRLSGQVLNEPISIGAHSTATDMYDLNAIGNPFPSEIFLDGFNTSSGVGAAMYRWNAETRQYSAQVDQACVHGLEPILRPMDVVFFHIPPGEEVELNYGDLALRPEELQAHHSPQAMEDRHVRLKVQSPSGSDETLIRFHEEATWSWDRSLDAMKIASTDELMPGFGSISEDGRILSINSIPMDIQDGQVFLYLEPGVEGQVQISPLMIDGGGCFSQLHLEDSKTGYFHDLIENGAYISDVLLEDNRDRFVLHFNRGLHTNGTPIEGFEEQPGSQPFNSHVYNDHLFITMTAAPSYDGELNSVRMYSMGGSLVLDQVMNQSENRHSFPLHISSGVYYLEVRIHGILYRDKVWVD